jgi:hypothetical protein
MPRFFNRSLTFLSLAECVPGASNPEVVSCDSTGGAVNASGNVTCNQGYYSTSAPRYCKGMSLSRSCRSWGWWTDHMHILNCARSLHRGHDHPQRRHM